MQRAEMPRIGGCLGAFRVDNHGEIYWWGSGISTGRPPHCRHPGRSTNSRWRSMRSPPGPQTSWLTSHRTRRTRAKQTRPLSVLGMKRGIYVRLLKLVLTPDAVPDFSDQEPKTPLPVKPGFWIEGYLGEDIALTGQIYFENHIWDGREVRGVFRSSPICIIRGNEIITQLSAYRLLKVPPFDPERSLQAWDEYGDV